MKWGRGFAIKRLMNAMRQAHADGWFIVFDTLTLADDRLEAFYDKPNALRDYLRDIGRMGLADERRKANDSHADCYQYFCVFFFQAEDGIRDYKVTGVQTCALPISPALSTSDPSTDLQEMNSLGRSSRISASHWTVIPAGPLATQ